MHKLICTAGFARRRALPGPVEAARSGVRNHLMLRLQLSSGIGYPLRRPKRTTKTTTFFAAPLPQSIPKFPKFKSSET